MKKTFKTLVMMFALTFGVLLFAGTESKAATWQANLKQTEATTTRISFAWDSYLGSTPAEKYYIYFSTSGVDGTWGQLSGSEYERGNTCTVYGLSAGAVYYLKVVPVTIDGDVIIPLAESETIIVGTKPDVPKVTGLKQIGATRNSIAMSWGALAGASYYEVYRYNSYNNYTKLATVTGTTASVSGLTTSTAASYFVIAYVKTAAGIVGCSSDYERVTMKTIPSRVAYTQITNLWTSLGEAQYGWNAVNNVDGYQFQYLNYKGKTIMTKETTSTYMSIRPYKVGQFTRARVRAYIIVNNTKLYGNWSDYSYNATSSKVTLKRSANKKKITVKWKKVKGVAGYTVYVSTKSNGGWKKVKNYGKKATKAIITKYGKKKLSKNKTYYVKVAYMIKVKGKKITSSIYSTGAAY